MATGLIVLIYAVVIISIILIHEAGHFVTAKQFGIKVEEFFVGFGPRLWSFRRGETEYGVKLIPAGGYVRIAGMNPFEEVTPEEYPRTFGAKPIWQRAVVIAAGPVTHFVIALLLLVVYFLALGSPKYQPEIGRVCSLQPTSQTDCALGPPSPAQRVGLRPGDRIVAFDGRQVPPSGDPERWVDYVVNYTRGHVGEPITLKVIREGRVLTITATPELAKVGDQQVGRLGVTLGAGVAGRHRYGPIAAVKEAGLKFGQFVGQTVNGLRKVFGPSGLARIYRELVGSQARGGRGDVLSVVGGGRIAVEAVRVEAWDALFLLAVGFNIFIGILNLIPLPPLDGGHLAVLLYEKVRRRKPDVRKLVPLTALVAGFMILFGLAITFIDIIHPFPLR